MINRGDKLVMDTIYLALWQRIDIARREKNGWPRADPVSSNHNVTSLIARAGVILAGTAAGGLRSDDNGQSWQSVNEGLTSRHVRWLAYHPDVSNLEFAGTEPA